MNLFPIKLDWKASLVQNASLRPSLRALIRDRESAILRAVSITKSFQCTETFAPWKIPQCTAKTREHRRSLCSLNVNNITFMKRERLGVFDLRWRHTDRSWSMVDDIKLPRERLESWWYHMRFICSRGTLLWHHPPISLCGATSSQTHQFQVIWGSG